MHRLSRSALFVLPLVIGRNMFRPNAIRVEAPLEDTDRELHARIETLMRERQLFRNPNLALARLGRRIGTPACAISMAVNRVSGENVSRYINGFRVHYAADLLSTSDLSVTEIMLESGFVSKSSFNAEFRRIIGRTPTELRETFDQP